MLHGSTSATAVKKGSKPEIKKITIPNPSESSKIEEFAGKNLVFLDNYYSRNIQNS